MLLNIYSWKKQKMPPAYASVLLRLLTKKKVLIFGIILYVCLLHFFSSPSFLPQHFTEILWESRIWFGNIFFSSKAIFLNHYSHMLCCPAQEAR